MKAKLFFILLFLSIAYQSQTITTVGLGYPFTYATGIAKDSGGNLYICDATDELIMKIDAHNKTKVISEGMGKPSTIAFDSADNLYVAYQVSGTNGGKIFKMNSDGSNPVLFANPNASISKIKFLGLNLWYIASGLQNKIGRVTLSSGAVATINLPVDVSNAEDFTFDTQGNSYFVFPNFQKFYKIDNIFSTYTMSNSSGTNILCIDYCPNLGLVIGGASDIAIMNTSGTLVTKYALPVNPAGQIFYPQKVEANEFQNAHFIIYDIDGKFRMYDFKYPDNLFSLRGSRFNSPQGITTDANNFYTTDYDIATGYNSVKKSTQNNNSFGHYDISNIFQTTNSIAGISYVSNDSRLYFADKTANSIKRMNTTVSTATDYIMGLNNPYLYKSINSTDFYTQRNYTYLVSKKLNQVPPFQAIYNYYGVLNDAKGFDFDNFGNAYVTDYASNIIQKINISSGTSTTLGAIGNNFNKPSGVAVDSQNGYVYVADTDNNAVKRMNLDGSNIVTISNNFYKPEGICLDATNTKLYVADTGNHVVKIVDVSSFLAVSDPSKNPEIKIYPNPTSDFVEISSKEKIKSVALYDFSGKLMMTENNFKDKISLSTYPKGVYLMKIIFENGKTETQKIIKK